MHTEPKDRAVALQACHVFCIFEPHIKYNKRTVSSCKQISYLASAMRSPYSGDLCDFYVRFAFACYFFRRNSFDR